MSALELVVRLVSGVLLVGTNAFFVAVEFALTRLADLDLDPEEAERTGLDRAVELLDRLEIHLTGCQLGISTSSVLLGVIAEPAITVLIEPVVAVVGIEGRSVHGISVVVAVVVLNLLHKIWGEQAPTYLGVERPREVAQRLAPILEWWTRIMHPVIKLGDGLAKWTLRLFGVEITRSWIEAEAGEEEGEGRVEGRAEVKRRMARILSSAPEVSEDREREVIQAFEIGEIDAREVMVPVEEVVCLALDLPIDRNRERLASGFVRYPVVETDPDGGEPVPRDRFVGVLYVPRLFDPPDRLRRDDPDFGGLAEEPVFLPADLAVAEVIDRLQAAGQEVALLTGSAGGGDGEGPVVGMITVTDALEAIAGEVRDPLDPESP